MVPGRLPLIAITTTRRQNKFGTAAGEGILRERR